MLFPQLRDAFDATTGEVAAAIPAYFVPFAVFQLVSGTIGERLGRRRVVRTGYVVYASRPRVAAAVAPTIGLFIVARAASGTANAFLTPLLLAGLAEVVPRGSLGRAVGTFAAVQTSAIALAPAVGGLLGEVDWRLAFIAPAVVAVALAFFPPPDPERLPDAEPARLRAVLTRRVGLLSAAAFAGYAGVTSLGFLVALRCRRRLRPGLERARRGAGRLRRGGHGHRAPVGAARRSPRAHLGDRRGRGHLRGARGAHRRGGERRRA